MLFANVVSLKGVISLIWSNNILLPRSIVTTNLPNRSVFVVLFEQITFCNLSPFMYHFCFFMLCRQGFQLWASVQLYSSQSRQN